MCQGDQICSGMTSAGLGASLSLGLTLNDHRNIERAQFLEGMRTVDWRIGPIEILGSCLTDWCCIPSDPDTFALFWNMRYHKMFYLSTFDSEFGLFRWHILNFPCRCWQHWEGQRCREIRSHWTFELCFHWGTQVSNQERWLDYVCIALELFRMHQLTGLADQMSHRLTTASESSFTVLRLPSSELEPKWMRKWHWKRCKCQGQRQWIDPEQELCVLLASSQSKNHVSCFHFLRRFHHKTKREISQTSTHSEEAALAPPALWPFSVRSRQVTCIYLEYLYKIWKIKWKP